MRGVHLSPPPPPEVINGLRAPLWPLLPVAEEPPVELCPYTREPFCTCSAHVQAARIAELMSEQVDSTVKFMVEERGWGDALDALVEHMNEWYGSRDHIFVRGTTTK